MEQLAGTQGFWENRLVAWLWTLGTFLLGIQTTRDVYHQCVHVFKCTVRLCYIMLETT